MEPTDHTRTITVLLEDVSDDIARRCLSEGAELQWVDSRTGTMYDLSIERVSDPFRPAR